MSINVTAKLFFLTYSQAGAIDSKQALLDQLNSINPNNSYICVAKELHEDGGIHYHCIVAFDKRKNVRNARFFDFCGVHPNIQAARSFNHVKAYIEKDGDYISIGTPPQPKEKISWINFASTCTREEWMELCMEQNKSFGWGEAIWKHTHPSNLATIQDGHEYGVISGQLASFTYSDWERSLVLIGPTGCGKTSWAIKNCLKPSIIISHLDRLKDFDPDVHKSIIFDDMLFSHLPQQAQIHLVDWFVPRDIHCRYRVCHIPAKTPKIFTANERVFVDHPAVNRRIKIINILTLYTA